MNTTLVKRALEKSGAFVMNTIIRKLILELTYKLQVKDPAGRWYIDLTSKGFLVESLKGLLNKVGCFDFYSTNSGEYRIGVSQIVGFLYVGYKWLLKGITVTKDSHQIHHYSGEIGDNRIENLVILTVEDHQLISKITNEQLDARQFVPEITEESVRYNNQGKKVTNPVDYLKVILAKTLESTQRWLTKAAQGKGKQGGIKEVVKFIETTLKGCCSVAKIKELAGKAITSLIVDLNDPLTRLAIDLGIYDKDGVFADWVTKQDEVEYSLPF